MPITWVRQDPQGHEVASCDDGYELTILDLTGVFHWQLARPTPGHGGFIESGKVRVVKGDREWAREVARYKAEAAFAQHLAIVNELEAL